MLFGKDLYCPLLSFEATYILLAISTLRFI